MAIPVARVHLAMAHAALPALLPTPPKWKILPLLPTPCPCAAAILRPKPLAKKPSSRADSDERWDARKNKQAIGAEPSASSSSGPRSAHSIRSKNATSPLTKPGRADSVDRWDAHKKAAASPASSSSPSSSSRSGMSSQLVSSSKWAISRASSSERWDVHKKRRPSQAEVLDDGESSSTGSNDINMEEEEEEILWKPRANMYAGPGFAVAAPEPSLLPMPTMFLVRVA